MSDATESWLDKLLAMYPPPDEDEEENCRVCLEEDGLCQEAAEGIVEDVAWACEADEEDVARWMLINNVSVGGA